MHRSNKCDCRTKKRGFGPVFYWRLFGGWSQCAQRRTVAISTGFRAELRYGQMGMAPDERRRKLIDSFLLRLPTVEWSIDAADRYGALKHTLKTQGAPVGDMDTLIAAHALSEKLALVTHNTQHLDNVAQLKIEDWMV